MCPKHLVQVGYDMTTQLLAKKPRETKRYITSGS